MRSGFRFAAGSHGLSKPSVIDTTVAGVDGQEVTVKYKDGEKKIIIGKDAVIRAYVAGDKSELKPGAHIAIVRADKMPDGTLQTARINVGRAGVVPQYLQRMSSAWRQCAKWVSKWSELTVLAAKSAHRVTGVASLILLADIGDQRFRALHLNFEGGD